MIIADTNVIIDFWNTPTEHIIAYLAKKNNAQIWTNDKHFSLIKKIIPELELFEPKKKGI